MTDVTVISVCFNSAAVVGGLLRSAADTLPVVLVDNGSDDIELLRGLAQNAGVRLVELGRNIGYGAACNEGAAVTSSPLLLFLNPDCDLQPDAVTALRDAAERHPNAVAFNPALMDEKTNAYFKRGSVLLPRHKWLPRGWPASDQPVPVLSGAAMLVRKADFDAVAGFDSEIFLYHEDDDLSLRLAERGDLMFIRDAVVVHCGGRSSPGTPSIAALKGWHMGRSRVYAGRKHGVSFPFMLPLVEALAQCLSPGVLLASRKRSKQVAFLRGVLSMRRKTARTTKHDRSTQDLA